jgi:hypothetical protein
MLTKIYRRKTQKYLYPAKNGIANGSRKLRRDKPS